jgi:hypothetical protein
MRSSGGQRHNARLQRWLSQRTGQCRRRPSAGRPAILKAITTIDSDSISVWLTPAMMDGMASGSWTFHQHLQRRKHHERDAASIRSGLAMQVGQADRRQHKAMVTNHARNVANAG